MIINHLGKTVKSKYFEGIVDYSTVDYIRNNFYNENKELAVEQLKKVVLGGMSKSNYVYNYYFERLANDTIVGKDKYSINQVLESDELIQLFHNRTFSSKTVFKCPDNLDNTISNFKTALRLGGKGICRKPTQFPIKVLRELLDDYTFVGDTYYDPCAGWGMRLMVAAEKGLKYVANDTNLELVDKLNELGKDINEFTPFDFNISTKGSENLRPELINQVDFVFTSPPYFDLEVYEGSGELLKGSYENWLENFITPLIQNCIQYTKNGKYIAINIKNGENPLYDDTLEIGLSLGLELVEERMLKQTNRTHTTKKHGDSSERIMVFKNISK